MTERDLAEAVAVVRALVGEDDPAFLNGNGEWQCPYCLRRSEGGPHHTESCPVARARDWLKRMEG